MLGKCDSLLKNLRVLVFNYINIIYKCDLNIYEYDDEYKCIDNTQFK